MNDNRRQSTSVHPLDSRRSAFQASATDPTALSANLTDDIRQSALPALIHSTAANEYKRGRGFYSFRRPMMARILSLLPVSATVISIFRITASPIKFSSCISLLAIMVHRYSASCAVVISFENHYSPQNARNK